MWHIWWRDIYRVFPGNLRDIANLEDLGIDRCEIFE
jgi:hypothetical protein